VKGSRVVRQIWDGEKWVFQYRYKEGKTEIVPARYRNSPIVDQSRRDVLMAGMGLGLRCMWE
jgi:hypothetical protein